MRDALSGSDGTGDPVTRVRPDELFADPTALGSPITTVVRTPPVVVPAVQVPTGGQLDEQMVALAERQLRAEREHASRSATSPPRARQQPPQAQARQLWPPPVPAQQSPQVQPPPTGLQQPWQSTPPFGAAGRNLQTVMQNWSAQASARASTRRSATKKSSGSAGCAVMIVFLIIAFAVFGQAGRGLIEAISRLFEGR